MKDYYSEFLQIKIADTLDNEVSKVSKGQERLRIKNVNTLDETVSKVSKGQNLTEKQAFDTFDTSLSIVNSKIFNSGKTDFKCPNCMLEMISDENGKVIFCPLGCGSQNL